MQLQLPELVTHLVGDPVLSLHIESMTLRVSIGKHDIAAILGFNNLELGVLRFTTWQRARLRSAAKPVANSFF